MLWTGRAPGHRHPPLCLHQNTVIPMVWPDHKAGLRECGGAARGAHSSRSLSSRIVSAEDTFSGRVRNAGGYAAHEAQGNRNKFVHRDCSLFVSTSSTIGLVPKIALLILTRISAAEISRGIMFALRHLALIYVSRRQPLSPRQRRNCGRNTIATITAMKATSSSVSSEPSPPSVEMPNQPSTKIYLLLPSGAGGDDDLKSRRRISRSPIALIVQACVWPP